VKGIKLQVIITILLAITLINGCAAEKTPAQIQIQVDASQVVGILDSSLWANIGYESHYGDTVDERMQPFWEWLRQTQAIRYVRCHNTFSDGINRFGGNFLSGQEDVKKLLAASEPSVELAGTGATSSVYCGSRVYSEDRNGEMVLDFWHLDHVFDVLLSAGVKPIVECDYMPDALAEGQPIRNYAGGLVNTPKDYTKWRALIYQTVKHCIERYGAAEVRSWYWEIWGEPNLTTYFIDEVPSEETATAKHMERFLKMYDYFAEGAKAADPGVRVGGPAIARRDGEWLRLFLEHCTTGTNYANGSKGAPIDFISWHAYGSLDYMEEINLQRQEIIELFPQLKDCPQLVDEWGQEFSPVNPATTLTNYEAAFLCEFLDRVLHKPERQLDLFLRWGKISHPDFTTGWRPLCVWVSGHIIPLPIMNAYTMLAKMGDKRLAVTVSPNTEVHGFASRTDNGVQILLYRFVEQDTLDTSPPVAIDLTITGLPDASWIKHYRIDARHSNAITIWEDMGHPATPSEKQLMELASSSPLQLVPPSKIKMKNGRTTIRVNLPANALSLFVLDEEYRPPFTPGEHITQVLEHEAAYQNAQRKLTEGDTQGAKTALERLIKDCVPDESSTSGTSPHCFWGQKALFALAKLEERSGDHAAADLVWQRLLKTTLNDTDRFIILKSRLKYLESKGNTLELRSVQEELEAVCSRLETFAGWSVWSDNRTE
jgi:xylan 1,4-beta-xylosidase